MYGGGGRGGSARPNRLTLDDDRFYIALFSALEQTHCTFVLLNE